MRDLDELGWTPRRRNPFGPLDTTHLHSFEARFGVKLPDSYLAFLRSCNGGWLEARYFHDRHGAICEVNDVYGLGAPDDDAAAQKNDPKSWDFGNLWSEMRVYGPVLGVGCVPIGRDGGDNQLYLDLNRDPASVYRFVAATQTRYPVAPTFEAFVDMLRADLE